MPEIPTRPLADSFADLWRAGPPVPDVWSFLRSHPHADPAAVVAVLLADQWRRHEAGCPRPVEDYLAAVPTVATDPERKLDLVYGEYRAARQFGHPADSADMLRRFPDLADALSRHLALDALLTSTSPAGPSREVGSLPAQYADRRGLANSHQPAPTCAQVTWPAVPSDGGRPEAGLAALGPGIIAPQSPSRRSHPTVDHPDLTRSAQADRRGTQSAADPATTISGDGSHTTTNPPTSAGRYELGGEIARGGMGIVYRAIDTVLGREVAVKVLHDKYIQTPAAARRFADEARITSQLQHPAIPPVHDLGALPDGRPFLAMKLIQGDTLHALFDARPNSSHDRGRFIAVFEQVCQALAFSHSHNVIHRDLKPANVMVGAFGEVQVMDWGLAKILAQQPRASVPGALDTPAAATEIRSHRESDGSCTQAGSILGTPAFMPPEQAAGELDQIDARSDVFGLGAILCVLLTGKPPFDGQDAKGAHLNAVRGKTEGAFARLDASGADPDVIALCKRCLAFEPADRPADAGVVAAEVAALRRAADDRVRQAERDKVAAATVKFVEDRVFAAARPKGQNGGLGKDVTLRDAIVASLPALQTDFADQPLVEARLRITLGTSFLYLGEAETAAAHFQLARKLYTVHGGPDHPDTLRSIESLATSSGDLGRHTDALQLRLEVLTRRQAQLGPDHPDTVASMSELAKSYNALGRHAEALELREQTLSLRKVRPGPNHPDTLATMNDLAASYYFLGRHAEALELREQTLALREARLQPNHPDTLASMFDVAVSYLALSRNAEALARFEETLALREAALGPTHPDTLWTLWGVATSHAALGRHADALRRFEQTFEFRKDRLGADHPDTLWTVWGLAKSLVALGRGAEAVPLIDECVMRHAGQVAYPRLIPGVLDVRLRYLEMAEDAAGCRQTAVMWEAMNRTGAVSVSATVGSHDENRPEGGMNHPGAGLYTAARMRAVAAVAFDLADQSAEAIADADRAMAWLTKAVAAGYRDREHMLKDKVLDPLRTREDFQALLTTLSMPSEAATPPPKG